MGGESKSTTTQSSTTRPWEAAEPMLSQIMGKLSPLIASSGINAAQTGAIDQLTANGQAGNPYAPAIGNTANALLAGGGATNEAGRVNQAYDAYMRATQPLASNTDYNPLNMPGFKDAINTITSDVTSGVNGQFAAAGRSFSGANSQALGRGITQGVAPVIAQQYNQNVQNQQNAARGLYDAGNGTAALQAGLTQQDLANRQAGIGAANDALTAKNWGPNAVLTAQQYLQSIPAQQLSVLASLGIPIAGLGSQSTGTTTGTQQMSGAQQFATIMQGIGQLMPKGPMNFSFGG